MTFIALLKQRRPVLKISWFGSNLSIEHLIYMCEAHKQTNDLR